MGKKTWEGVYARETSILVYFRWNGRSYRETLKLDPTPRNLDYAERLRRDILKSIERGDFSIANYFPDSPHAGKSDLGPRIEEAIDQYIQSASRNLAVTSARAYKSQLLRFFRPHLQQHVGQMDFPTLDKRLSEVAVNLKSVNFVVVVVRSFLDYAVLCKWLAENPAKAFKLSERATPEPDPLEPEEVEDVLADMAKHYHPQIVNYFEAAFFIGFRPSEGVAVTWRNLDRRRKRLRISAARVHGIDKDTKTHKSRDVELHDRAYAAIERQRQYTQMAGGEIFTNPVTGRRWSDSDDLVRLYWHPSLKRLGIRGRDARQTRHTCATMMLMAGCNPAWCAKQLGHSVEMFLKVYSTWIDGADGGLEMDKLSKFSQRFHSGHGNPEKSDTSEAAS